MHRSEATVEDHCRRALVSTLLHDDTRASEHAVQKPADAHQHRHTQERRDDVTETREFDISSIDEPASRPMAARVHVTHHRGARDGGIGDGAAASARRHRELPARDHA